MPEEEKYIKVRMWMRTYGDGESEPVFRLEDGTDVSRCDLYVKESDIAT